MTSLCSAVSYFAAVPLAKRFGLMNTMVFTHLPSSLFLILTAFAPTIWIAFGLLILRSLLSQMDVPTRSSYVMAVVRPEERPAAASVTAVPRSLASAVAPLLSGWLLTVSPFGWPLVLTGTLKAAYDLTLLWHSRPSSHRRNADAAQARQDRQGHGAPHGRPNGTLGERAAGACRFGAAVAILWLLACCSCSPIEHIANLSGSCRRWRLTAWCRLKMSANSGCCAFLPSTQHHLCSPVEQQGGVGLLPPLLGKGVIGPLDHPVGQ